MLTTEQEIELLINVLSSIEDDEKYTQVAMKIIEKNEQMKLQEKLATDQEIA